jgi:hypothetical protein
VSQSCGKLKQEINLNRVSQFTVVFFNGVAKVSARLIDGRVVSNVLSGGRNRALLELLQWLEAQ